MCTDYETTTPLHVDVDIMEVIVAGLDLYHNQLTAQVQVARATDDGDRLEELNEKVANLQRTLGVTEMWSTIQSA